MIRELLSDVSFKGIKTVYEKAEKDFKSGSPNNSSGFMDPKMEKSLRMASKSFEEKILRNPVHASLKKELMKCNGDLSKASPEVTSTLKMGYDYCKEIMNQFKSNKNINENSVYRMYVDLYEFSFNKKYVPLFNKAFSEFKKSKSLSDEAIIIWILLILFVPVFGLLFFIIFVIIKQDNDYVRDDLNPYTMSEKELEMHLEDIASKNKSMLTCLGFPAIRCIKFVESLKNPVADFEKALKSNADTRKALLKGREGKEPEVEKEEEKDSKKEETSEESGLKDKILGTKSDWADGARKGYFGLIGMGIQKHKDKKNAETSEEKLLNPKEAVKKVKDKFKKKKKVAPEEEQGKEDEEKSEEPSSGKDRMNDIKKNIETKKKATESFKGFSTEEFINIRDKYNVYMVDRSNDRRMGKESLVMGVLILAVSILGIWLLVSVIRCAVYWIGSMRIDIFNYIKVENEYLKMNIEMLRLKQSKTTDPRQQKKIDNIIKKQLEWQKKFEKMTDEFDKECVVAYADVNENYEKDEQTIASTTSDEPNDDFEIQL